ncbi:MAG TPA: hypothetical protein VGH60_10925 [Solirubrobacteraceae bacterium]|jgi:hypothetical protein
MSVSSEVQRTLVKSPPELWAELSDPTTLARHLGELGEIRILRTEPDRAVDWEAAAANGAQATGRVEIEPSGWGTKVTLSAQRAIVEPEPEAEAELEAEPEVEAKAEVEAEPEVEVEPEVEAKAELEVELIAEAEPEPIEVIAEPEPAPEIVEPAPRFRFFARFFRRRRQPEPTVESAPTAEAPPAPVVEPEPEPIEEVKPEPVAEPEPIAEAEIAAPAPEEAVPEPGISAELAELEERTTAVLTGVLDRLGAAHHRPFSRS